MDSSQWYERPYVIALFAFGLGAIIAAIIVYFVVSDGDGDDGPADVPTPTIGAPVASATPPAQTPSSATPAGENTPAGEAGSLEEALANLIRDELAADYIGPCPEEIPPEPPEGLCSVELEIGEDVATYFIGAPFSEGVGEAVLVRGDDGTWTGTFIPAPELGADTSLSVGIEAVVYGVGSCLNFRGSASASAAIEACRIDGTRGQVVAGPEEADGATWWQLEGLGWASDEFLIPAS